MPLLCSAWERSCLTYEFIKQSGTECTYCDSENSQVQCTYCDSFPKFQYIYECGSNHVYFLTKNVAAFTLG